MIVAPIQSYKKATGGSVRFGAEVTTLIGRDHVLLVSVSRSDIEEYRKFKFENILAIQWQRTRWGGFITFILLVVLGTIALIWMMSSASTQLSIVFQIVMSMLLLVFGIFLLRHLVGGPIINTWLVTRGNRILLPSINRVKFARQLAEEIAVRSSELGNPLPPVDSQPRPADASVA